MGGEVVKKPPRMSELLEAEAKARGVSTTEMISDAERRQAETARAYERVPMDEVRSFFASMAEDDDSTSLHRSGFVVSPKPAPPPPTPIRPTVKPIGVNDFDAAIAQIEARAESPIERLLGVAIVRAAERCRMMHDHILINGWVLECQSWIGRKYRADFELAPTSGAGIVVEADGHAFHEKTPEQAGNDRARDNWMQVRGYRVLRFTGTQITRHAERCALDVFACMRTVMDGWR